MASGLVIHVEVGPERHTEVLAGERIRIGAGADCALRFQPDLLPQTPPLLLELARTNGAYRVADFDRTLRLTHNGAPLKAGREIADGDQVQLAGTELTLQFFPLSAPPALVPERQRGVHVAPFIEDAALEAAATARRDDAKVFLREFTRELLREINLSTKLLVLLFAVALVGGTLYLGFAAFRELKQGRRQIEAQNQQIAQLNQQIRNSQQQFEQVDKSNKDIIYSLSLAPKLRSEYGAGVCLISGTYIFVETSTGRPLRYPETQPTPSADATPAESEGAPFLTAEGRGPVAEFPYVGTGFHVGGGYVVTNRHVAAEPWVADERSLVFGSTVSGKPRVTKLVAYFPGQRQPYVLRLRQIAPRDDLAVCTFDLADETAAATTLPALPLDSESEAAAVGKAVVLMGYPSGPDRILASLPDEDANNIKQRFGSSVDVLVGRLAELNLIKPLTTQGHITDFEAHRIIYDARTAEGGSGAPLFGQSGRVIGVNFAIFTEIQDANFAVPIRYAIALLQRAGWKPATPDTETATNSNTPPKDARTAAASNQNR
ncbi:MAG TPA: serine protease [Pyrinomonadaceae bacterium]|jgi:S1-C subfamily serine protease